MKKHNVGKENVFLANIPVFIRQKLPGARRYAGTPQPHHDATRHVGLPALYAETPRRHDAGNNTRAAPTDPNHLAFSSSSDATTVSSSGFSSRSFSTSENNSLIVPAMSSWYR